MELIRLAKGALIAGIGDRKGRRALQQHASRINRRGGKRVRQPEKDRVYWVHPHAQSSVAIKLQTSTALHAGWTQNKENCENQNSDANFMEDEDEDCL
jgi:hypothetical protein